MHSGSSPHSLQMEFMLQVLQQLGDPIPQLKEKLPDPLFIILGDLNRTNLTHKLPKYRQPINCPIRDTSTADNCSTILKEAYPSIPCASLRFTDHCLIHLILAHRQKFKTSKSFVRTVRKLTEESNLEL